MYDYVTLMILLTLKKTSNNMFFYSNFVVIYPRSSKKFHCVRNLANERCYIITHTTLHPGAQNYSFHSQTGTLKMSLRCHPTCKWWDWIILTVRRICTLSGPVVRTHEQLHQSQPKIANQGPVSRQPHKMSRLLRAKQLTTSSHAKLPTCPGVILRKGEK